MPWKEVQLMKIREQFVLRAQEPGVTMSAVCGEFGISRKTGYKWLERHAFGGLDGLRDRSRRPLSSPLGVSAEVAADAMSLRQSYPSWGPRKIAKVLNNRAEDEARGTKRKSRAKVPKVFEPVVSERTVARILERAGLVQVRRRVATKAPTAKHAPAPVVEKPNDLWTIDYKGWWKTPQGERCEPLTVRDAFSRYILDIRLMEKPHAAGARQVLEDLFERHGLPKAILSDNGSPFACPSGQLGMTKLSVWWLTLNIEHIKSRVATPADNGAHERMHRDMKRDLKGLQATARRKGSQPAWDLWRDEFNTIRPHEALGLKTPSEVYRNSPRQYDPAPIVMVYSPDFEVRLVDKVGHIHYLGARVFISRAVTQQNIGLLQVEPDRHEVWLGQTRLGQIAKEGDKSVFRRV